MNREELKQILREKGVSELLVEMPAVVEPLYKELMDCTTQEVRTSGRIVVDDEGNFSFDKRQVKVSPGSGATISFDDVLIEANSYGIEIEYSDGNWQDYFSNISRKEGRVDTFSGNNGNATGHGHISLDNGAWSIRDTRGPHIVADEYHNEKLDEETDAYDLDEDQILRDFDERASKIISNYPSTEPWFIRTRESVREHIERQNDPDEKEARRIQRLERKVIRLEAENKRLRESGERTATLLEKALAFIGEVKKSPAGKVFFGKKLRSLEMDSKSLSKGEVKEEKTR